MTATIVIAIIGAVVAIAGFSWQVVTFVHNRRTRIVIKVNPLVSSDATSWTVNCTIVNQGQNPVHIRRVHIALPDNPAWYVDLCPSSGEEAPVAIGPASEATYVIEGEQAASALGNFGECACMATTSDDKVFAKSLQSKGSGQDFELMCLVASLKVDDGSGSQAAFPWPEDRMRAALAARLMDWKLNCAVSRGWIERRAMPDGEVRYFITDEGREVKDTGTYTPQFDSNDLNGILDGRIAAGRRGHSRRRRPHVRLPGRDRVSDQRSDRKSVV